MDPIMHSGQLLAGRYQLTEPYKEQRPQPGTQLWSATDRLLGREVRVLVLHPQLSASRAVVNAARRTSLIDDPRIIRILSVDDSQDASFIASEVPAGQRLTVLTDGARLRADQVAALTGSIAQSLAAAQRRGLYHLHIDTDLLWVTSSGDVYMDGVGVAAALDSSAADLTPVEIDRREVHQLLALAAALLTGHQLRDIDDDDLPSVFEAALLRHDLPEGLRLALEREHDGYGVSRVSDLEHQLSPWVMVNPADFHNLETKSFSVAEAPYSTGSGNEDVVPTPEVSTEPGVTSFEDVLHGATSSPTSPADPIRVGPNANPTVRAVFPKITAPLGGTPKTAGPVTEAIATNAAAPSQYSPNESATSSTAPTPATTSPDEPTFGPTERLSGTAVIKAVVDPYTPNAPPRILKSEVSAGFAAGLAAASANNAFFTPQWAPSGDDVTGDAVTDNQSDSQRPAKEDVVIESKTPEIAEDPDVTADIVPIVITNDPGVSEGKATVEQSDPKSPRQLDTVVRTSVFAATAGKIGSSAAAPSITPARPYGEPSVQTFEELGASAPASVPDKDDQSEKQYNPSKVITLGAVILVAVGLIWSVGNLFRPTADPQLRTPIITTTPTQAPEGPTTTQPSPEAPAAQPAVISNVTLLNPEADTTDEDSPGGVPYAWDGNTGTGWSSWWYGNSSFAGKDGVGLEITLAAEANVSEVVLNVAANGGNVQWRKTDASTPSGGDLIAESAMSSETILKAAEPFHTSTIIIWFNQLPVNGSGENRIELLEINVR